MKIDHNRFELLAIVLIFSIFLANFAKGQTRQFSIVGITAHGVKTEAPGVQSAMRNKLTSDGFLALNPQLNYTFNYADGTFYNTTALIDCYGDPAGFIGYGKKYQVESDLKLGYMAGVYARLFPNKETIKFGKIGNYQILPFPALIAEYEITETVSIRMSANYLINFFDLAWEF